MNQERDNLDDYIQKVRNNSCFWEQDRLKCVHCGKPVSIANAKFYNFDPERIKCYTCQGQIPIAFPKKCEICGEAISSGKLCDSCFLNKSDEAYQLHKDGYL